MTCSLDPSLLFVVPHAFLKDGAIEQLVLIGYEMGAGIAELTYDLHVDSQWIVFIGCLTATGVFQTVIPRWCSDSALALEQLSTGEKPCSSVARPRGINVPPLPYIGVVHRVATKASFHTSCRWTHRPRRSLGGAGDFLSHNKSGIGEGELAGPVSHDKRDVQSLAHDATDHKPHRQNGPLRLSSPGSRNLLGSRDRSNGSDSSCNPHAPPVLHLNRGNCQNPHFLRPKRSRDTLVRRPVRPRPQLMSRPSHMMASSKGKSLLPTHLRPRTPSPAP